MKPENKIYKEGGVYNNSKCCYNIKKKKKKVKDGAKMELTFHRNWN